MIRDDTAATLLLHMKWLFRQQETISHREAERKNCKFITEEIRNCLQKYRHTFTEPVKKFSDGELLYHLYHYVISGSEKIKSPYRKKFIEAIFQENRISREEFYDLFCRAVLYLFAGRGYRKFSGHHRKQRKILYDSGLLERVAFSYTGMEDNRNPVSLFERIKERVFQTVKDTKKQQIIILVLYYILIERTGKLEAFRKVGEEFRINRTNVKTIYYRFLKSGKNYFRR